MASKKSITAAELKNNAQPSSCWLAINGVVWDLTTFAPQHPGGANVIYKRGGSDASDIYNGVHGPSLIANELDPSAQKGVLDEREAAVLSKLESQQLTGQLAKSKKRTANERRPLLSLINTHDFEEAAREGLSAKAWAFFSSAATDCVTREANTSLYHRIWLRPRIMRNVKDIRIGTRMLGNDIGLPLFVSPAAMAKLAHPDGEIAIARGCAKYHIPQTVSTNASLPLADITASADTTFFFQLYVNKDRSASENLLQQAEKSGVRAIVVTVDQPTPGKREEDERAKADADALIQTPNGAVASNDARGGGLGRTMGGFIDPSLNWNDVAWLRRATRLPIMLKGVLTPEDVVLAAEHGIDAVQIGNHGGRSLDTSTPAILALLELQRTRPDVFQKIEVYIDGGIRRGTDMFKALCLGARAVGMGRHFLYSAMYGSEGVAHMIEILKDEFETTMRMMGCTDLDQLHPGLLNLGDIENLLPKGLQQSTVQAKL